jgi:hypothetical protein
MRSKKQINASRQNGAHSQGPVSIEGKKRVSQNAYKHGLAAMTVCLHNESREAYDSIVDALINHFNPVGDLEFLAIEEIATPTYKLRRCWSSQTQQYELQMAKDAAGIAKDFSRMDEQTRIAIAEEHHAANRAVENLRRYEEILSRQINRGTNRLLKLQKVRRESGLREPDPPQPIENTQPESEKQSTQNKPKAPTPITPFSELHHQETSEKETEPCTGPVETPPNMN